jgi:hypothetical protein
VILDDGGMAIEASQVVYDGAYADPLRPVSPPKAPKPSPGAIVRPGGVPSSWKALWASYPLSVRLSATCIAKHESWDAGLWKAHNPVSSASGFAQWIDSTWRVNAKRAGVNAQSSAASSSPANQVKVFAWMVLNHQLGAWNGTNCPGT